MSTQATTAPQDPELPAGADAIRIDALSGMSGMSGMQQRDATDVMRMLFRSECFVEDLDDVYLDVHLCAMH